MRELSSTILWWFVGNYQRVTRLDPLSQTSAIMAGWAGDTMGAAWRFEGEELASDQRDAALLALKEQETVGDWMMQGRRPGTIVEVAVFDQWVTIDLGRRIGQKIVSEHGDINPMRLGDAPIRGQTRYV